MRAPSFVALAPVRMNADSPISQSSKIDANAFYDQYNGHPIQHLRTLAARLPRPAIWLAGDSTLDNKYWIPPHYEPHPCPHHTAYLSHPLSKRDISYWLNRLSPRFTTVNCAIEATTLAQRSPRLLAHDLLVAQSMQPDDILVVSIGGNDVALAPTFSTVMAVLANVFFGGSIGMSHLTRLFRDDIAAYIQSLTDPTKPKLVLVCMVYYPDEAPTRSWAGFILAALAYNRYPRRLQDAVKRVYENAISNVTVEGVTVVPVPFFEVLNGKQTSHYVERVEPSEEGGRAMATQIIEYIEAAFDANKSNRASRLPNS